MSVQKKDMIYEGKAKKVYNTDNEDLVIVSYKDDATAFNGVKRGTIVGKGVINNRMSNLVFQMLEANGIPTHYVEEINDRETVVRKVDIVKVEVIVRNIAAGSISKRLGLEEGTPLETTVLEYSYKDDDLGDPMINDYHIAALGIATKEEMDTIAEYALKANDLMIEFFKELGIKLVDFKLEFGRYKGEIILADETSPDTCRFWDAETNEKLDKDRFRRDLGGVEEAYEEVFRRLTKGDK
jgi:phosphoribosylaminoimidazole-succinocarboxamide synthase